MVDILVHGFGFIHNIHNQTQWQFRPTHFHSNRNTESVGIENWNSHKNGKKESIERKKICDLWEIWSKRAHSVTVYFIRLIDLDHGLFSEEICASIAINMRSLSNWMSNFSLPQCSRRSQTQPEIYQAERSNRLKIEENPKPKLFDRRMSVPKFKRTDS